MSYSVLAGGKRFRPILTYTTASLYDIDLIKVDACACAIELIHIYSLIHDDLPAMDNDDMRHNQPSSHKTFGEAQAILAGDGIQALAFEVLSRDESIEPGIRIELLKLLAISAYEMADGQSIDLSVVTKKVDIEFLNNMHKKKTGSLISCAVKFGALINNNGKYFIEEYEIYYAPSLSTLSWLRLFPTSGNRNLLALGNPVFSEKDTNKYNFRDSLTMLPSTEIEVNLLKEIYESNAKILLGLEASEKNFKECHY